MGIKSGEELAFRDIYIYYNYENVLFRWDYAEKKAYRKFEDETEEMSVAQDNRLFNDALLFGDEISEVEYLNGKPNPVK